MAHPSSLGCAVCFILVIWEYYITTPGGIVECPPDGKKNFLSLVQDEIIGDNYSVAHGIPEAVDLSREIAGCLITKGKQKQCYQQ